MSDDTLLELNFSTKTKTEFNTIEWVYISELVVLLWVLSLHSVILNGEPYEENMMLETIGNSQPLYVLILSLKLMSQYNEFVDSPVASIPWKISPDIFSK